MQLSQHSYCVRRPGGAGFHRSGSPGETKKVLHSFLSRVTSRISLVMFIILPATGGTRRKSRILAGNGAGGRLYPGPLWAAVGGAECTYLSASWGPGLCLGCKTRGARTLTSNHPGCNGHWWPSLWALGLTLNPAHELTREGAELKAQELLTVHPTWSDISRLPSSPAARGPAGPKEEFILLARDVPKTGDHSGGTVCETLVPRSHPHLPENFTPVIPCAKFTTPPLLFPQSQWSAAYPGSPATPGHVLRMLLEMWAQQGTCVWVVTPKGRNSSHGRSAVMRTGKSNARFPVSSCAWVATGTLAGSGES